MYYIRFLKPPILGQSIASHRIITTLITITSDLGDELFPNDIDITSRIVIEDGRSQEVIHSQRQQWKTWRRVLILKHHVHLPSAQRPMRLLVFAGDDVAFESQMTVAIENLPLILPAWSNLFNARFPTPGRVVLQRRWNLSGRQHLRIKEDGGESIARHIWYFSCFVQLGCVDIVSSNK